VRKIITALTPPIVLGAVRWAAQLTGITRSVAPHFEGPLDSWQAAAARSDGWDAQVIVSKTLDAQLKVRDGIAAFQQDTIVYDRVTYSQTILAFIAMAASISSGDLNIIDFGGSLGTNFFQNKKILRFLMENRKCTWTVIERPIFAELGNKYFKSEVLRFDSSLQATLSNSKLVPEAFLFSGSLEYVPDPLAILDQCTNAGAKIIALDRVVLWAGKEHAVFVQHPDPNRYYRATYPIWAFSKDILIGQMIERGMSLVEHFTSTPNAQFDICGMIFAKYEPKP
jgi:putative methyltransferase (TIGR04325 family)